MEESVLSLRIFVSLVCCVCFVAVFSSIVFEVSPSLGDGCRSYDAEEMRERLSYNAWHRSDKRFEALLFAQKYKRFHSLLLNSTFACKEDSDVVILPDQHYHVTSFEEFQNPVGNMERIEFNIIVKRIYPWGWEYVRDVEPGD